MKGVPAVYLGRIVEKEHFRTFVYAPDGKQKLVESWDEFERCMESGLWFSTKEDATTRIEVEKPKRVRKAAPKSAEAKEEPIIEEEIIPVAPETVDVKDDGFLPKED